MDNYPEIDRIEQENLSNVFYTGQLMRMLGFTRDTLRYYEEIGLLTPQKDENSRYRQYRFSDYFTLMGIEFYKKRGLTITETSQVMRTAEPASLPPIMADKERELEQEIQRQQRVLAKLRRAREFCETLDQTQDRFSIREFGVYEILSEFQSLTALEEYPEKVLRHMDLDEDDLLSALVRVLTFDESGYKDTKACLVAERAEKGAAQYLQGGPCMYTVVESGSSRGDNFLMESTRIAGIQWAEEHGYTLTGTVYLKMRLILLDGEKERIFVEAWAPIKVSKQCLTWGSPPALY